MIKRFGFYWRDGSVNYAFAETFEEAAEILGLSGGIMRVLDYWDSQDTIPYDERMIFHNGKAIVNPIFVEQLRGFNNLQVGDKVSVKAYNRE